MDKRLNAHVKCAMCWMLTCLEQRKLNEGGRAEAVCSHSAGMVLGQARSATRIISGPLQMRLQCLYRFRQQTL